MRRIRAAILAATLIATAILAVSCREVNFDVPKCLYRFYKSDGNDVVLSYEVDASDHAWYSCDKLGGSPVEVGCTDASYTVEGFSDVQAKYFYCICSGKASDIFCVFSSGLPTVSVGTDSGDMITSRLVYVGGELSITGCGTPMQTTAVQLKGRGHSSWEKYAKKGYNLKFDSKTSVLGMAKSKKWCFIPCVKEPTLLGNWCASLLGREVFNDAGMWEPSFRMVDLFLNGEYWGCYAVGETIKLEKNRLDFDDIAETQTLEEGGFVVEFTAVMDGATFTTLHGLTAVMKDPDLEEVSGPFSRREILDYVRQKVNALENSIYADDDSYMDFIDLDSLVDWYLVNEFLGNREADFETSVYMTYDPEAGKFLMGPNWDFDRTIGITEADELSVATSRNLWFTKLMEKQSFVDAVKAQWRDRKDELVSSFQTLMDQYDEMEVAIEVNNRKWPYLMDRDSFDRNELQAWLDARYAFIDSYIESLEVSG